jgi:hypothetical protein
MVGKRSRARTAKPRCILVSQKDCANRSSAQFAGTAWTLKRRARTTPHPHQSKEHVIREPLPIPSLKTIFEVTVNGKVHRVSGAKLQRWILKRREEWKGPRGQLFKQRPTLGQ